MKKSLLGSAIVLLLALTGGCTGDANRGANKGLDRPKAPEEIKAKEPAPGTGKSAENKT